jgi:polyhydroxybutyrate depolymerase
MRSRWHLAGLASLAVACGSSEDPASEESDGGALLEPASGAQGDPSATALGSPQSGAPATQAGGGTNADDAGAGGDASGGDASGGDAGGSDAATPPPSVPPGSCGVANPAKGFIASKSVTVGGVTRTYALDVPAGYDGTKLYPLVVGFHGDNGTGAGYRASFPIVAQGGTAAIFAWPNGTNNNSGHSFDQLKPPATNADVAFFDALVTSIATTYCVNKARVYAHGSSGGAFFTNQLGRWRSSAIRGIAAQSGGGPFGVTGGNDFDGTGALTRTGPVAAFIVHGQADGSVNISSAQQSLAYWRAANKSTAGQTATAPSPCQKQNGGTKPVVWCSIPGLGHAIWPSSAAAIWSFFAAN